MSPLHFGLPSVNKNRSIFFKRRNKKLLLATFRATIEKRRIENKRVLVGFLGNGRNFPFRPAFLIS
jgi:hypothetical protein